MRKQTVNKQISGLALLLFVLQIIACNHETFIVAKENGFPAQIAPIMDKCSNAGCHNDISKDGAAGLSLASWETMFEGGNGGTVTIPYGSLYSTLLYYTNIDSSKGPTLLPTMPYNLPPLSSNEYEILVQWINDGAPNKDGYVKWSDFKDKSKLYICNRGCDVITVMDADNGLAMRYVPVGKTGEIEAPSVVKASPDKLYWYVAFNNGTILQKFRTSDNTLAGEMEIGFGVWSAIEITNNSKYAFVTDNEYLGKIHYVDLETMQIITTYSDDIKFPLNACLNAAQDQMYVTSSEGNYIYKFGISDPINPLVNKISLVPGQAVNENPSLDPYDFVFSPDESKYFVSCKRSAELRIFNTSDNSLIDAIPVGSNPVEMYASSTTPYLILSCMGAAGTVKLSSIYIFNHETNSLVQTVYAGHESRGFAMDESSHILYVANRNVSTGGPAAHHAALCSGQNGYITAIDLNTFQLIPSYRKEISVDPYDMDIMR